MNIECQHCGSQKEPFFSRIEPIGYHCRDCGKNTDTQVDRTLVWPFDPDPLESTDHDNDDSTYNEVIQVK